MHRVFIETTSINEKGIEEVKEFEIFSRNMKFEFVDNICAYRFFDLNNEEKINYSEYIILKELDLFSSVEQNSNFMVNRYNVYDVLAFMISVLEKTNCIAITSSSEEKVSDKESVVKTISVIADEVIVAKHKALAIKKNHSYNNDLDAYVSAGEIYQSLSHLSSYKTLIESILNHAKDNNGKITIRKGISILSEYIKSFTTDAERKEVLERLKKKIN